MDYFLLKTKLKDEVGLIPSVYLNMELDDIFQIKQQFTYTSFYQSNTPISFWLYEREGVPSRILDINKWTKSAPSAHRMIISPRFKQILEKFVLPVHRFYEAYGFIPSERSKHPLFVFHFHFNYIQEIILEETTFEETNSSSRSMLKRRLEKGAILQPEEFYVFAEENAELTNWFYPDKLRFKPTVYYDLFATEDGIIINEKVKQAIEEAGITGVEMIEYKEYEISMNEK